MRLILFDIDGTLVDSGEAGTRSMNLAFKEIFSLEHPFRGISMAGKTDIQIVKEALRSHNIAASDSTISFIVNTYLRHLSNEIRNDRKYIKPGIINILERLSDRTGCALGLLTGNIEQGAKIKLDSFDLTKYFSFAGRGMVGAFGSDNEDRAKLLPVAVTKYKDFSGKTINYEDCIVVGDTPLDVHCVKPYGAFSIAVATGPYSAEHLRLAGADAVFGDLSDIEAFMGRIS